MKASFPSGKCTFSFNRVRVILSENSRSPFKRPSDMAQGRPIDFLLYCGGTRKYRWYEEYKGALRRISSGNLRARRPTESFSLIVVALII
jgi:hypothetical protein